MQNPSNEVAYPLLRKGHQLSIVKVPDEFTMRTQRGVDDASFSASMGLVHKRSLRHQNLSVVAVEMSARDEAMAQVRGSEVVHFASHVYALENDPLARIYLTDEICIQFQPSISADTIEQIITPFGINYVKPVVDVPNCFVFRLTEAATANPVRMAAIISDIPEVILAEANVAVPSMHHHVPADTLFDMQWHLYHEGGIQLAAGAHVSAVEAWEMTRGDRSVVVAIADDSVDLDHRDFQGPGKIVGPRDFKGLDFLPAPEAPTDNHGTSCAGVAVAEENGQGVVGIAPGCSLMPIRTSGLLDDNSIEALFRWAVEQGASVISNSWGPSAVNFPLSIRQDAVIRAAARNGRNGKGCVICFAAGNSNRPVNGVVDEQGWPNGVLSGPTQWFNGYAVHPDIMTVSACTSLNKKSAYSSWGQEVSVCAPSNNTHPVFGRGRTYPLINTAFPGRGIVTTDRVGPQGYSSSDYTSGFGGTSSACPLVAGVAALVISANPQLTAREVREIIEQTADKIEDASIDPQLGVSLGTYDTDGHSQWFGHGKVNAERAVSEAIRRISNTDEGAQTIQKVARPALTIPDNNPAGIVNELVVEETGVLRGIAVGIKIAHSYIGDLSVELQSPNGVLVPLHSRNGGNGDNLFRVYNVDSLPGLVAFAGTPIQGTWRLFVKDLAPQDVGRLEEWSLQLVAEEQNRTILLEEAPGLTIPDSNPEGLVRTLLNEAEGKLQAISVEVDISHTYVSDLRIRLQTPSGQIVTLHDRAGGSKDNIMAIYDLDSLPMLAQLLGSAIKGEWAISVQDLAKQDVGKLNRWALRLVADK